MYTAVMAVYVFLYFTVKPDKKMQAMGFEPMRLYDTSS